MAGSKRQPPPAWTVWLSARKKFLNAVRDAFQAKIKSAHRKSFPIAIIAIGLRFSGRRSSGKRAWWRAQPQASRFRALSSLMVHFM